MKFLGLTWQARELQTLAVICTMAVGLLAFRLDEAPIGAVTDDAYYVEMARSVAEGLGPVLNVGPERPPENPGIFPPGFPYLLSPLAWLWPDSLTALKAIPLLAFTALLPLTLWLPGPGTDNRRRLALAAIVMLNPWVIGWAGRILSDLPYTALSLGALLLFLRWRRTPGHNHRQFLLVILLCAAAVSVRTIGWAAVLAITAALIAERRWLQAAVLPTTAAAAQLAIGLTTGSNGGLLTPAYTAQMFQHAGTPAWRFALENLLGYVAELPVLMVPVFGNPLQGVLSRLHLAVFYPALAFTTGTALLVAIGTAIGCRWRDPAQLARVRLFTFYLLIYAAALAQFEGYPSGVQTRLLIPLLPILAWLLLAGLRPPGGSPWPLRLALGVMLLAALGHNGWRLARPLRSTVEASGHGLVDPGQGMKWLRENAAPGTVVMAQDPLQRHIHCGLPLVAFPTPLTAAALAARVEKYAVGFIVVGPVVTGQPDRLDPAGQRMLGLLRAHAEQYEEAPADSPGAVSIFRCP